MTDSHLRVLAAFARDAQLQLDDYDAADRTPDPATAKRRLELTTRAARTRARLTAARARRQVRRATPSAREERSN